MLHSYGFKNQGRSDVDLLTFKPPQGLDYLYRFVLYGYQHGIV